jgi:hypothetical protein
MRHLAPLSLLLLALLVIGTPLFPAKTVAPPNTPPPIATKFLDLFDRLRAAQDPDGKHEHVAFNLTESDINEYLRYSLKTTPRPGLDSITVKFFPKNYISTFTKVDFDSVERWHPGTIPVVLRPMLKGKKSIWIDCRISATNSKLTFSVEKARYDDLPLPAFFVEKMIQIMAARQPEKYDTAKPLPMPFALRNVWTEPQLIRGNN